jgi:hypothetical protein
LLSRAESQAPFSQLEEALLPLAFAEAVSYQALQSSHKHVVKLPWPIRVLEVSPQQVSNMPMGKRLQKKETSSGTQASGPQLNHFGNKAFGRLHHAKPVGKAVHAYPA